MASPSPPWNRWRIVSLDPEVPIWIEGTLPPDRALRRTASGGVDRRDGIGSNTAIVRASGGSSESWSIAISVRAEHNADPVLPVLEQIRKLPKVDPALGRRVRCLFEVEGQAISGVVTGLEETSLGTFAATGLDRGSVFSLDVVEFRLVEIEEVPFTLGETVFATLAEDETFEEVADRAYGDPYLGEVLRWINGAIDEEAGRLIKVYEADHPEILRGPRTRSAAFAEGYRTNLADLLRQRA